MTKKDISEIFGISRPTIDKFLKDDKKKNLIFFLLSFSKFDVIDKIYRYNFFLERARYEETNTKQKQTTK